MPPRHRAVRRAGAGARAHPHLPADPARPVERARRRARRRAGRRRAAEVQPLCRCRTRCSSTSPRRWPATGGCGCSSTRPTGWSSSPPTGRSSRRCCASAKIQPLRRRARSTPTRVVVHPSERGHLKQVLLKLGLARRGPRRVRRRRGAPDRAGRGRLGRCGPTSERPSRTSGTAAPGSSCCPAVPARRSSARPRWRRPRRDHADPRHQHRLRPAVEATSCSSGRR